MAIKKSNRSRLISLIHAQKSQAGLDDETYRLIISGATGKQTCTECSMKELKLVFRDLNSVLSKQGKQTYTFRSYWETPTIQDAVTSRAKRILGDDWKGRLDRFADARFQKSAYTECDDSERRSIMAFLTNMERRERNAK